MRLIAAATIIIAICTPALADVHPLGQASETRIENVGELSRNQRAGLEKFKKGKPYFGAIFFEQGGTGWGSFTGAHNMKDAASIAQRICEKFANGGACDLAGVIYPRDLDLRNIPTNTLSKRGNEKFAIYSGRAAGHRAFAVSSNSAFGWATRRDTAAEALEVALANCWSNSMKNLLKLEVDLRETAMKDGLYTCRIIDHSGTRTPPS